MTGVCSTRNVDLVRSLGADHVVDYTADDFARAGQRYDVIFDLVGNRSLRDLRRAATPKGTVVFCGGGDGKWVGPMLLPLRGLVVSRFVGQQLRMFLAQLSRDDLLFMSDLVADGKLDAGRRPDLPAARGTRGDRVPRGGTRPGQGRRHRLARRDAHCTSSPGQVSLRR